MIWARAAGVAVMALALGCTSATKGLDRAGITPDELLEGTPLGVTQEALDLIDEPELLWVSPEMRAFLDSHVHRTAGSTVKLQELVDAIIGRGALGLEFAEVTRTASETFRLRSGNCLSFSNMFVAMAREVGLSAHYQEVDLPPDWTLDRDVFVLNRHVNVLLDLESSGGRVVDFNIGDFRARYDTRTISDLRALSHNYNNMGAERMQASDAASALGYFRRAIADGDRRFSPAWTNLGTLYLRAGHLAHAEACYLQALSVDPEDSVAMSNLARLYERQGDAERAAHFRRRVTEHRMQNPYYRYYRAREAFLAQDYDTAIGHLKFALRERSNEDRFYSLLGECYRMKGDERAARRWLARAEQVAAAETEKHRGAETIEVPGSTPIRGPDGE